MLRIPHYLQSVVKIDRILDDTIIMKAVCDCGSTHFFVLKNNLSEGDEAIMRRHEQRMKSWTNIENYTDPTTNIRYLVTKNMFGKICDKIPVNDVRSISNLHVVKIKCSNCGKENIIFDNRYHGYGAINFREHISDVNNAIKFKTILSYAIEVIIKIINDLTFEEYCDEYGDSDPDGISNAFTNIEIYTIRNGKKKVFFEEETS